MQQPQFDNPAAYFEQELSQWLISLTSESAQSFDLLVNQYSEWVQKDLEPLQDDIDEIADIAFLREKIEILKNKHNLSTNPQLIEADKTWGNILSVAGKQFINNFKQYRLKVPKSHWWYLK